MKNKIRFPVKYIENNMVLNHDGEWYAYYELIPYNYSFLSNDEMSRVYGVMDQLVNQMRAGNMHFLQIATEVSIRNIAEQSKSYVTGELAEAAVSRIDSQTDALVGMIGEHQIDYRYYIGFKLVSDTDTSLIDTGKSIMSDFIDFIYGVNGLMGDYTSVSNIEVSRYSKHEQLLCGKLCRRFKFRRCNQNDFGYIIEHIYGSTGTAYEDYEYHLPHIKVKGDTLIKSYDVIRPAECRITEHGRYLELDRDDTLQYVSYMTISDITQELDFPGSEIFYYQQGQFDFPVSVSMNVEIVPNYDALATVRNKKKELKDLDDNAYQSGSDSSGIVYDALEDVSELEDELNRTKDSMYKLSYVIRVAADNIDELKSRCNIVKDYYDDYNIKLVRPYGDMIGLHGEFVPSAKRYINDYIQYVTSGFIASLGFGATQQIGEASGIYFAYNIDTGKNVYVRPELAAQGVGNSTTNALAAAFLGSLRGGKSFANNLLLYYAVLFGGKAVIIDPKSERGNWPDMLPEIADFTNVINITSDESNRGLLDPYVIMSNLRDAESLALDILTFMTGISARDGERFSLLRKAVRAVTNSGKRGMLCVIDELRNDGTVTAASIAEHIESFTDYDFAHLLFSDGLVDNSISLDSQLSIIQIADLVLPDKNTAFNDYTITEMLSVAMLIVISTFALDFIHSDRSVFKIIDLDEAWTFLNVAQGKVLANKLIRAGRAMNAGVYFITQSAADLQDEQIRNNIGLKFAFRSTDIDEIKNTLEFFGLDAEDESNQKRLRELENGQCLMQDIYGHTGVVQVHPVFQDLFDAFDTRPPVRRE